MESSSPHADLPPPSRVPAVRIHATGALRPSGDYVLYWMTASRRARSSFALERAVELCRTLGKPLVVLEPLRAGYPWASDRIHRFVIDGMHDNARAFEARGVTYVPYVEPRHGEGRGLLERAAEHAAAVVADDSPMFFLPRMRAAALPRLGVRVESVDDAGLVPLRASSATYPTAYAFRRFAQRCLAEQLFHAPLPDPLDGTALPRLASLPAAFAAYPRASRELLERKTDLSAIAIDHAVGPVALRGGSEAARARLAEFVRKRLEKYGELRSHPDADASSGLSPYLHFGHLSPYEVLDALARNEGWTPAKLGTERAGKRDGFWGMSATASAFLDELVTWRELGWHQAAKDPLYDRFEGVPEWARASLRAHEADRRPALHTRAELTEARTSDRVWNAAQRQLTEEGIVHNYLRMVWGKRPLEWHRTAEETWDTLVDLNNRYALDGRDPSSYTGIAWCFGRYDRPWGPERPIFGLVRYMSSDNTVKKLDLERYLDRFGRPRAGSRGAQGSLFGA
jgi:deoxyribodipyrimidine photo-lyase